MKTLLIEEKTYLIVTILSILTKYFDKQNIYTASDENSALSMTQVVSPQLILINYNAIDIRPIELLSKLSEISEQVRCIIYFSREYRLLQEELKSKFLTETGFSEIILIQCDEISYKLSKILEDYQQIKNESNNNKIIRL